MPQNLELTFIRNVKVDFPTFSCFPDQHSRLLEKILSKLELLDDHGILLQTLSGRSDLQGQRLKNIETGVKDIQEKVKDVCELKKSLKDHVKFTEEVAQGVKDLQGKVKVNVEESTEAPENVSEQGDWIENLKLILCTSVYVNCSLFLI